MFDAEDNILIPDSLDDFIKKGITDGVKKKRASRIRHMANAAAITLLVVFTISVRTSPVFAAYMIKVPGLEYLVRFINYDKGLQSAVENNFIQNINSSITKEGITFTVKDAIIDNSKAMIFYSIENNKNDKYIELSKVKPTNEKGEELPVGVTWSVNRPDEKDGNKKVENVIEISFVEKDALPDKLNLDIKLGELASYDTINQEKVTLDSTWSYDIPVDKEKIKAMEKSYILNQTIEMENQKITFGKVTITPTRIAVEVEYDEKNSKKILGYDYIEIADEKGNQWGTIMNGVSGSRKDDNHETIYFQSNYFDTPKHLYIKASNIRTLDKDKLNVLVDLDNNKLIKAPDDKLKLMRIDRKEKETYIVFSLERDKLFDEKFGYFIFSGSFKDSSGNSYYQNHCETYMDMDKQDKQVINFVIDNNINIKSPVSLELYNYPERITGSLEVKIK